MAKSGEVVLSATERMLVEKQKAEIRRMRMSKEQLEVIKAKCNPAWFKTLILKKKVIEIFKR